MEIRPTKAADRAGYVELYRAVASEGRWIAAELPIDADQIGARVDQAMNSPGVAMFVADNNSAIVGAIGLIEAGGIVQLGMLVDANQRGVGLGGQLLTVGIDWSRSVGSHKMSLEVWPHNARAIALYRRMGFEIEGRLRRHFRRRNGELWDAVVMGLTLDEESPGSPHEDALELEGWPSPLEGSGRAMKTE